MSKMRASNGANESFCIRFLRENMYGNIQKCSRSTARQPLGIESVILILAVM